MKTLTEAQATLQADDYDMDSDIQELFIEEAVEVLQEMDINLPQWNDNPNDFSPLLEIRRGFHTIKGSARMVGANNLGEVCWAVEDLLNRVLDNSLPMSDEIVEFVNQSKEITPYLVSDFANQESPSIDPAILLLMANNLRHRRLATTGLDGNSSGDELDETFPEQATETETESVVKKEIIEEKNEELLEKIEEKATQESNIEEIPNVENIDETVPIDSSKEESPKSKEDIKEQATNEEEDTEKNTAEEPTSEEIPKVENTDETLPVDSSKEENLKSKEDIKEQAIDDEDTEKNTAEEPTGEEIPKIENTDKTLPVDSHEEDTEGEQKLDESTEELPNTLLINDYFDNYDNITSNIKSDVDDSLNDDSNDDNNHDDVNESMIEKDKVNNSNQETTKEKDRSLISPKYVDSKAVDLAKQVANSHSGDYNIILVKKFGFISVVVIIFIFLAVLIF